MRVVLNGLAALKPKTGVGHHVADLTAALTAGHPDDAFTLYPGRTLSGWVSSANRGGAGGGTTSGSYVVWLYAHRVTVDSLFQVLNDLVDPKLSVEPTRPLPKWCRHTRFTITLARSA